MPEPVMYIRGFPRELFELSGNNAEMLADLDAVADLTDDQIGTLCQQLSQAKGFLDPQSVRATIRKVVKDDVRVQPSAMV